MTKNGEKAAGYIVNCLKNGRVDLETIKKEAAKKYGCAILKNSDIMRLARVPEDVLHRLRKKPVRTLSGITPVAVMVRPEGSCQHFCIYCPYTGKAPKSYTGDEPAALRARNASFSVEAQIKSRIRQYRAIGHPTDKCEVIVMGGTFLEMPLPYRISFIKEIYETLNGKKAGTLCEAQEKNETAKNRVVGLTIETRPDRCGKKEINEMLEYGATRVELGVQHPDDSIYCKINRGHTVKDVAEATALLKDSAFKVLYHVMPGLPGSDRKKDILAIRKIFAKEQFRPDMLKIYPTLCVEGTELYEMMKRGEYCPYTAEEAAELIAEMFRYIPKYVRVMRIQRDIPANLIADGVKKSNLREYVQMSLEKKGIRVKEIRSREAGLKDADMADMETKEYAYRASSGREFFISFENNEAIAGFVRMRMPKGHIFRPEIDEETALIRELHVYGREERIGMAGALQHTGIGKNLMKMAEEKAKELGCKKILVISGVGAREYYRKIGYAKDGPYMSKTITDREIR